MTDIEPVPPRAFSDAEIAAIAAVTPILYDAEGVSGRAYCGVDRDHHFRVYFGHDLGRKPSAYVGPAFERPLDAGALCDALSERLGIVRGIPIAMDVAPSDDGETEPEEEPTDA